MPAPVLQVKRGALSNLPGLKAGEPAFTIDTFDFFVGIDSTTNNNKFLGSYRYWTKETSSVGSSVKLVEGTTNGSNYVALKAPDNIAADVTYVLPGTQGGSATVLTNDGSGNLSWGSGSSNAVFSGITTFSDTSDSTTKDNGSVIIEGGVGIEKSVNIGGNLKVTGLSTFTGLVVANNGINVSGFSTVNSLQILNNADVDGTLNVDGLFTATGQAIVSGITTFTNTTQSTTYQDGAVVLDGGLGVEKNLNVGGNMTVAGNVTIGGTFVSLKGQDVYIENKDIILGFTTSITPNDDTANHAGVSIASTVGSPLTSFTATGINTLPDTYKQLMWFKSGTLGFSTDAFAFNYGLAIGTTSMANGVRLAVGSGITMSDTAITATTFNGALNGNATTATNASSADQVKTISASNANTNYYITFVDSHNGSATSENVYTDDGIYYNPGTNTFTTQNGYFTGNLTVDGTINGLSISAGVAATATRAITVDTTGTTANADYYVTFVDTLAGQNGETLRVGTGLSVNPSNGDVKVFNALSAPTVKATNIQAFDGTTAITVTNTTGAVGFANSVTIAGDLYVLGNTTEVNTSTLKVEDSLVDLGLINNNGVLVPPSSDLNIDIGVLFNWYGGSAKKASVYWDDSAQRVGIASDVTESTGVLTANAYAAVEIGSLWVTDCAGTSQVISCTGGERFLNSITIDAGTF